MRKIFALTTWAILFALSVAAGYWWSGSHPFLWALALWTAAMAGTYRYFLVSVPEITGLITVNLLVKDDDKKLRSYPTGLHFRFPWEQVKMGNYINIRLETHEEEETFPALDGPEMHVKWSYQYRPRVDHLDRYIAADDNTIKQGISDVGSSILSVLITKTEADKCKSNQHELEKQLKFEFDSMSPSPSDLYGIELVRVSLADVDYEAAVQKARATEKVAKKIIEIAAKIRADHPEISQKDALNAAMIMNGDITKAVNEVEGQGGQALAALLMAMAQGGKGGKK